MNSVSRFWNKVDTSSDCWLWLAGRNPSGYGQFTVAVDGSPKRKIVSAHRFAYELTYGSVSNGLIICHRCNNRQCVNPAHLYAGTYQDNANDRSASGKPRKERTVNTATTTIYPAPYYPIYKAWKTIDGWVVVYLSDRYTMRPVDGGKVHKHRQNAYAKAKRLNESLPQELSVILSKADVATYEWDSYTVAVGERNDEDGVGYEVTVSKEALPPHVYERMTSLEEVEEWLDSTLGYTKGDRKWVAAEREDD